MLLSYFERRRRSNRLANLVEASARRARRPRLGSSRSIESLEERLVLSTTFLPADNYTSGLQPVGLVVGDFTNDGNLDVATANQASDTITILPGSSTGTFGAPIATNVGSAPISLVAGRFNGDTNLDLAVVNAGSDTVSLLLGTGNGTFTNGGTINVGIGASRIASADLNADGRLDLAVVNSISNTISIFLGDGSGGFNQVAGSPVNVGVSPNDIALGQLDGVDGIDGTVANLDPGNPGTISLLLNNGTGLLTNTGSFFVGDLAEGVAVADFNGDGRNDIAATAFGLGTGTLRVFLNTGGMNFTVGADLIVPQGVYRVAAGDLDGDGFPDLAVTNTANNTLELYFNNGAGGFSTSPADSAVLSLVQGLQGASDVAMGDFNLDGSLDVAVANRDNNTAAIFLNLRTLPIEGQGVNFNAVENLEYVDVVVARFTDVPGFTTADYTATIAWGDGSTTAGVITQDAQGVFQVSGSKIYAAPGNFVVTTTIKRNPSLTQVLTPANATVLNGPINVVPAPIVGTEDIALTNVIVGGFVDEGGPEPANTYTASINWGDGTISVGLVSLSGSNFTIRGTKTYANPGLYLVTTTLTDIDGGTVFLVSTAQIATGVRTPTGALDPSSDCGVSSTDYITNKNQPTFFGTATPGAAVEILAQAVGQAVPTVVGLGAADAAGAWKITTTTALADGSYTITARVTNPNGTQSTIQLAGVFGVPGHFLTIKPLLVIDTIGPKITALSFDPRVGTFSVSYQDDRSGMDQLSLVNGSNYSVIRTPAFKRTSFLVTSLNTSAPGSPTAEQLVDVVINSGRPMLHGTYTINVKSRILAPDSCKSAEVGDVAGNPLDGNFYGYFPSGDNRLNANNDFTARLRYNGLTVSSPAPISSTASPLVPPGTPGAPNPIYQTPHTRRTPAQLHKLLPPDFGKLEGVPGNPNASAMSKIRAARVAAFQAARAKALV